MTEHGIRHPFLDDLADDVVFVCSVLREPVRGRDAVTQFVRAGASLYRTQNPIFLGSIGERGYFEYEVELVTGNKAAGLVSMLRNAGGEVVHLHIAFSGLAAVLDIAQALRETLGGRFPSTLFL